MISRFSPPVTANSGGTSTPFRDEVYALSGINMVTPDQVIDTATKRYNRALLGESPYTINSRMLSRDSDQQRVAIRTRRGSSLEAGLHTSSQTPVVASNMGAQTGELSFSATEQLASPLTFPTYTLSYGTYCLSYLDLFVRKDVGYVESVTVQVWTDTGGLPGSMLASSSFTLSSLTTASAVSRVYFMDAPAILSGQSLWMVFLVEGDTDVRCYLQSASPAGAISRPVGGAWGAEGSSVRLTSSCYRSGSVLSAFRRNVQGETPSTLVHAGYGDIVRFTDAGAWSLVYANPSGYEQFANRFRFTQIDNWTVFANGAIQPRYFDGTGVSVLTNAPANAVDPFVWNSYLFMRVGNQFFFSDILNVLSNANVWPVVNTFIPNTPQDPDRVVGSVLLKNILYVFTKKTKYRVIMTGLGISTLNIEEVTGGKGGLSQDLIATDGDLVYFVASDQRMYSFNGTSDSLNPISDPVEPEMRAAQDPGLYGSLHVIDNQVRYYYAKSPNTRIMGMLLYDITYGQWFLDTGRSVSLSITYPLEGNPLVEFSSMTTMAFLGNQGYSDAGKPIDFKYWTNYKAYGSGARKKRVKRLRPILKVSVRKFTMLVGKDMDFTNAPDMRPYVVGGSNATYGGGARFGDGTKYGSSFLVDSHAGVSGRGRHIQYRFEKLGVDTPVELYGYIAFGNEGKDK